jgi:3-isopropylmalate/(R)-2-methylmalate dehydratase large subunit
MHSTNFGAIGAMAPGVGPDIVAVLATGTLLTEVPHSIRVELTGRFAPGVHPRDLGFRLSHEIKDGALARPYDNRVIEFGGAGVETMPVAARVALCNTLTEIGVANTLFPPMAPDGSAVPALDGLRADRDAAYESRIAIDLASVTPQVAMPGAPENAVDIAEAVGKPVDHAYIGSCGSSMYEDFVAAFRVMQGRRLAPGVRMVLVPGSTRIAQRLAAEGLMQAFADAGAIVLPSGCGPCAGGRSGLLAPGEVSISTAATNTPGRMGAPSSLAYLGSPLTVAASAVAGRITDPREVLGHA